MALYINGKEYPTFVIDAGPDCGSSIYTAVFTVADSDKVEDLLSYCLNESVFDCVFSYDGEKFLLKEATLKVKSCYASRIGAPDMESGIVWELVLRGYMIV